MAPNCVLLRIIYSSKAKKMPSPLEKKFSIQYIYGVGACELINKV